MGTCSESWICNKCTICIHQRRLSQNPGSRIGANRKAYKHLTDWAIISTQDDDDECAVAGCCGTSLVCDQLVLVAFCVVVIIISPPPHDSSGANRTVCGAANLYCREPTQCIYYSYVLHHDAMRSESNNEMQFYIYLGARTAALDLEWVFWESGRNTLAPTHTLRICTECDSAEL